MPPGLGIKERWTSIAHALHGLAHLIAAEPNARIHAALTAIVLLAAFWLDLARFEWLALVLTIAAVWTAEAFNTALERLADALMPEHHPLIGQAKDLAAAAVLVAALAAVAVGAFILLPRLL